MEKKYPIKIKKFLEKGWEIWEDRFSFYDSNLVAPNGIFFDGRKLNKDICNLCENAEVEGCSGFHAEENLQLEKEAKSLYLLYKAFASKQFSEYLKSLNKKN